jgi:hypothetical protein
MPVHDVDMEQIRAGPFDRDDFLSQSSEVGGQD